MLVYSKARFGDAELRSYSFTSTDLSDPLMLRGEGTRRASRRHLSGLSKRPVALPRGDGGWFLASWFSSIERDPSADCYIFRVQPLLKRLVLDLRSDPCWHLSMPTCVSKGNTATGFSEMLLEGAKGQIAKLFGNRSPDRHAQNGLQAERIGIRKTKALKKWSSWATVTEINLRI